MAGIAASISGKTLAGMDAKGLIGALLTFYWGGAMIGRFIGLHHYAEAGSTAFVGLVCARSSGVDHSEYANKWSDGTLSFNRSRTIQ